MNILIADNNEAALMYLERVLIKKGVAALKAPNGEEALSLMNEIPFDAALIDINLPRMGGLELIRKIREEEKFDGVYIAALTGYAESDDIEIYLESGFNEVLLTPVDDYALYKFIDRVEEAKTGSQT